MDRRRFVAGGLSLPALVLGSSEAAWKLGGAVDGTPAAPARGSQSDERFESVARLVSEKMAEHRIPGVAVGVFKDGRTTLRGFGVTNLEDPAPVTPETIFPLASLSKTVAATAVMKLVEQGKVRLDAPVQTYLPGFHVRDEGVSRQVTVLHLLTHTPGWEGQLTAEDRGLGSLEYFADATMRDLPQISAPGSVWSYNNAGFTLAGRLLEVVTGRNIHQALRELVFAPLGLTRSFTRLGDAVTYRFAQGHRPAGDGTEVVRPFALSTSVTAGGVGMSISDVISYARFHLGVQAAPGAGHLSSESLASMRSARVRKEPTTDQMGVAWHIRPVGGVTTFMHGGTAGAGHRLLLEIVPERSLAFSILTNHSEGWRLVEAVERAILSTYERVALTPNQPICHRGINEAMTSHSRPLATQPDATTYVGTYRRPPVGDVEVRSEGGALVIRGEGGAPTRLVFYGPDVAYAESGGGFVGSPYEFVRTDAGQVGWIRVNGRVARKET
jgi:CubicO group peptidase (beta-lactamase class C family)